MNISQRLENIYSGAIHDVLCKEGYRDCVLPPKLSPLNPDCHLAGKVFTMSGQMLTSLDDHKTLLEWTGMLSRVPAGTVLICQPNDNSMAHMGELSAEALKLRGVKGYIVDGGCRDSELIEKLGFPVFCKYYTPKDIVGSWIPNRLGEQIQIGDVVIESGDYVVGDRDGVVVIPQLIVPKVTEEAEKVLSTENLVRKAIIDGEDPQVAFLKYGKF